MAKLTEAWILEFVAHPVWREIVERIGKVSDNNERLYMENADPFIHGKGVGSRSIFQLILEFPEELRKEITGESVGYKALRDKVVPFKK